MNAGDWPRIKKWRNLNARNVKVRRAPSFGFQSPKLSAQERREIEVLRVLFVCSMNKWRSPTAEHIFRKHPLLECRSAGTSRKARRTIQFSDIRWAELIVVMEDKHYEKISANFGLELEEKEIHVLGIEDNFKYMDEDLVAEFHFALDTIFLIEEES